MIELKHMPFAIAGAILGLTVLIAEDTTPYGAQLAQDNGFIDEHAYFKDFLTGVAEDVRAAEDAELQAKQDAQRAQRVQLVIKEDAPRWQSM